MTHDENNRRERFTRIRRVKNFLRYMPRRARLHKYPLIGRFSAIARQRSYLWSFKTANIRPALYAGSILSLMPFLGMQLPAAFVLALVLRANFMVLGGLQFLTNPVTAVPVYYGTYQLGKSVMILSGFGQSIPVSEKPAFQLPGDTSLANPPAATTSSEDPTPAAELAWTPRLGTRINALLIGGLISGIALGAFLDVLWRFGSRQAAVQSRKILNRKTASSSTDNPPHSQ